MFKILFPLALAALLSGCVTNPVTGEQELSFVSKQQEIAIGEQHYERSIQHQGGSYYLDPKVNSYINRIGQRLAELSHQPGLPYEFTVINSSVPNAWALPGGKIAINRGLLMMLDDEAQLAAVLGHEIVHITARHGAQQQTQGILIGMGAAIAQAAAGELGGLVSDTLNIGGNMMMARYGREDELEADYYGTQYISAAGYDPMAAYELQHKLMSLKDSDNNPLLALFASHPPSQERMQRNKQTASYLPGKNRNRAEFQRQLATLFNDFEAYQHYEKAEKHHQNKDYDKAISALNRAIKIQPKESSFWTLKAQALWMKEQKSAALKAYSSAVKYNPQYFKPYLLRGMTYYEQGDISKAEADLMKADRFLKTRLSAFYQGEIDFDRQNYEQAKQHYLPVAQGNDELGAMARDKLSTIQKLQ